MKTKQRDSSIRQFGQLSLPSSFLNNSNSSAKECQGNLQTGASRLCISLSNFLGRKLDKNPQKTIKERQSAFSLLGSGVIRAVNGEPRGIEKTDQDNVINVDVFRQFKPSGREVKYPEITELKASTFDQREVDRQDSRKRKSLASIDEIGNKFSPSHLVVLGDDPKPKKKAMEVKFTNTKTKSLFNHYASGSGWWDCNREGLDSEEVGCSDVWEGMGSTSLGGLEWH